MKNVKSLNIKNRLKRRFFNRSTLTVAQDLLGKILVFEGAEPATQSQLERQTKHTQSISSCDKAPVKASSGAYSEVCEQRAEPATQSQLERQTKHTQSISSCDKAPVKASSGAYSEVCEQRAEPATQSQLERRRVYGIITETEAYMGFNDPASHAAKGRTQRTQLMYGPAGFSYVYLIYGMYHCLNIVTEKKDFPAAVLIRGLEIIDPDNHQSRIHLNGPGKICKYLGINKQDHNGLDMMTSDILYVAESNRKITPHYLATPRIGIRVGQDKLWRYVICE